MFIFRETEELIEDKMTVEIAFKTTTDEFRPTIVRGIYTAWRVTKLSFTLNEDEPLKVVDNIPRDNKQGGYIGLTCI